MKYPLLLLAVVLLAPLARLGADESKPLVRLILPDDHSYPHAGCCSNKDIMTPNLDPLAAGISLRSRRCDQPALRAVARAASPGSPDEWITWRTQI